MNGKKKGEFKSYLKNGDLKEVSYYIDGIKQ
jgi:antitoxin component YwqK of YwqJK toxin-antitoxin module